MFGCDDTSQLRMDRQSRVLADWWSCSNSLSSPFLELANFLFLLHTKEMVIHVMASWPKNNRLITDGEIIDCLCRGNNREYPPGRQESHLDFCKTQCIGELLLETGCGAEVLNCCFLQPGGHQGGWTTPGGHRRWQTQSIHCTST